MQEPFTANPKHISIITINRNNKKGLEKSIQSVISQSYSSINYVVVDGDSTDGSVDIIKQYSHKIHAWISEPDTGIYDAMNKGLDMITGDYVLFLNSGDFFIHDDVLSDVSKVLFVPDTHLMCGSVTIILKNGEHTISSPSIKNLYYKMIPHPGLFYKTILFKKYGVFDTSFRIAGDFEHVLRLLNRNIPLKIYPEIISVMDAEGISSDNVHLESKLKELRRVTRLHGYYKYGIFALFIHYKVRLRSYLFLIKWKVFKWISHFSKRDTKQKKI